MVGIWGFSSAGEWVTGDKMVGENFHLSASAQLAQASHPLLIMVTLPLEKIAQQSQGLQPPGQGGEASWVSLNLLNA